MTSLRASESGDGTAAASLVQGMIAGLMCGFLAIVHSAGFGLLLLSGEAHSLVPAAAGMALFSTAIMAAVAAIIAAIGPGSAYMLHE
jgi:hypothetical protein